MLCTRSLHRVVGQLYFENKLIRKEIRFVVTRRLAGFSHSSDGKEIHLQCRKPQLDSWVEKIPWRRNRLPIPVFLGFPCGSAGKESACHMGDLSSIPGLGRSPREGKGYPFLYSGLENSKPVGSPRVGRDWTTFTSLGLGEGGWGNWMKVVKRYKLPVIK